VGKAGGNGWHDRIRLPGLTELSRYQRAWLRGDLLAGLTVAAYLVPQVMAYAGVAGLPPVAGLWAAGPPLVIYAALGSSRSLSMGPESTTALMTAVAIGPLAAGHPGRYLALAGTLALLVGLLAVIAGLTRCGFVADLLSRPVLVGYLAGLAAIMIAGQLGRVTGVAVSGRTFIAQVTSFASGIGSFQWPSAVLAAAVLAFLLVVGARWPRVPGPLISVVAATIVVAVFGLAGHPVAVAGQIPSGLPPLRLPDVRLTDLRELLPAAVGVLVVAFSDDVLTARSFGRRGERINANQELLALGVANSAVAFVQGFPVSSSASRTALGQASGSRTQLYSVAAAGVLLAILSFGHSLLAQFPVAALGALVIYAAIRLIDLTAFRRLVSFRRAELAIAVTACAGVLIFNILAGVLIAIGISVGELLLRVARPHDAILGRVPGLAGMHDVDDYPHATTIPGLVVYRYDAPLFFANAEDFRRRALAAAAQGPPTRWFVLNVEANVEVDFTALEAVEAVRAELTGADVVFALARVKQDLLARLSSFGLAEAIGDDRIFPTLPTAVDAYQAWVGTHPADQCPAASDHSAGGPDPA
jgi:high affinity sulfate transporter 1